VVESLAIVDGGALVDISIQPIDFDMTPRVMLSGGRSGRRGCDADLGEWICERLPGLVLRQNAFDKWSALTAQRLAALRGVGVANEADTKTRPFRARRWSR